MAYDRTWKYVQMKYTTKILVESKNNRNGECRIRYRVRWDKVLAQFLIPYTIDIDKWSDETKRCKQGTTHGKHKVQFNIINRDIQAYEDAAESIFNIHYKNQTVPTKTEFESEFLLLVGRKPKANDTSNDKSFFSVFDLFTENQGLLNSWSTDTYTKFEAIRKHLKNFNENITFDLLTGSNAEDYFMRFVQYLQSKDAMKLSNKNAEYGLRNSTVEKHIDFAKWFLRWACKKGYYTGNLHDTFKPKLKGIDGNSDTLIYFEWNELLSLFDFDFRDALKDTKDTQQNIDLKTIAIEQARDVFCFCCFSSLRYSDVAKLKRSDIKKGFIRVVTKKTVDGLKIELNNYSLAILEKYENITFKNDLALPIVSNVQMNVRVKEMAKLAGFDEPTRITYYIGSQRYEAVFPKYELITTHCGRRTFIVNSLYLGIPAEVVMQWTGHADYDSMKPYVKIVDELKRESMNKFNTAKRPTN